MNVTATSLLMAVLLQASSMDFTTRQGGRDIFPPAFHGTWAPSLAECRGSLWVLFDAATYRSPDNLATLVRNVRVRQHRAPDGQPAITLLALAEFNSEGQVGRGQVRISRAGPYLYMSNPALVGESAHWRQRNIRCPE